MGTVLRIPAEGNGILLAGVVVPVGETYRVISMTLALNVAATTSENLTIALDAIEGANYDVVLYSLDLSAGAVIDLLWQPDGPLYIIGGDRLGIGWANSNSRTWGLLLTVEVL